MADKSIDLENVFESIPLFDASIHGRVKWKDFMTQYHVHRIGLLLMHALSLLQSEFCKPTKINFSLCQLLWGKISSIPFFLLSSLGDSRENLFQTKKKTQK
jgi:hypothetical protein